VETWAAIIVASISLALSTISIYTVIRLRRKIPKLGLDTSGAPVPTADRRGKRLKRYLVFRVFRIDESPSFEELEACIKDAIKDHLGLIGYSEASIKLIRYRAESGIGVLRIVSKNIYQIVFSLSTIRVCEGRRILISPIKIAGTAKSAYKKISTLEKKYP